MQAVIMAGGKGTRLGPYSALFPKPLAPLGNEMPVLELLLRQFKAAGVTEVVLAVNHLHHLLRAFFGTGEALGITIQYSLEDKPLGTAGPLATLVDTLDDDFFVANGDLLTTVDFGVLMAAHKAHGAAVTVSSYRRESKIDFGVLEIGSDGYLNNYLEKPAYSHLVSMGLYAMKRSAVAHYLSPGQFLDIPDLLMAMTRDGERIFCHAPDCFWLDIGRPDDYQQAQEIFANSRHMFLKEPL